MTVDTTELAEEQKYFDNAWDEREQTTASIASAAQAAAGPRAAVGALQKAVNKELERRAPAEEPVAFGRFDTDEEPLYVGKYGVMSESRDVLVVNWQAPAAAPFYKATPQEPLGLSRVRKFETERNQILTFDDTMLQDLAERVDALTDDEKRGVDDALLRDLDTSRDGEMRDIVQTIHASQYDLIRRPLDQLLVIQGGPGTGKTAVALHRASWLLFNHRDEISPEDVLVVGPSKTFRRYIQKVLPGLGNDGVAQSDLTSLGPVTSSGRQEPLDVARLKGDARMADLLRRALWQRVRLAETGQDLTIGTGTTGLTLRADTVGEALATLRDVTYNTGRQSMRIWLNRAASEASRNRGNTLAPDAAAVDASLERIWPQLTPAQFLQDLLSSRLRITNAAGDDFTAGDIDRLHRTASSKLSNETWSDTDVALLDEANSLINGRGDSYAHVIVDEAQDLSPMQLRSIRRRSTRGSCTIVGDVAQSTGAWSRSTWSDVIEALRQDFEAEQVDLAYGYRVPKQMMVLADRLLPLVAPGLVPAQVIRSGPSDPAITITQEGDVPDDAVTAASQYAGRGLFIGVICAADAHDEIIERLRVREINFQDAAAGQLSNAINVMTAVQSKGLEFDAVVVVEPAAIADGSQSDLRELYIALTRTTKHMTIVHSRGFAPLGIEGPSASAEPFRLIEEPIDEPLPVVAIDDELPVSIGGVGEAATAATSSPPGSARPKSSMAALQSAIVAAAAPDVADRIREAVVPGAWAELLSQIAAELNIDTDELIAALQAE